MKISRKALYAIRALTYVAAANDDHLCTITEIAQKEEIPREYIARILKELTAKGFLTSYRGIRGGYRLNRSPDEISFLSILEAVQGPFGKPDKNISDDDFKVYDGACSDFWSELHGEMRQKLMRMNLARIDYSRFYPQTDG